MARRSRDIKIVIHNPQDTVSGVFTEQVTNFWKEKIIKKINESNLDEEEREYLKKKLESKKERQS